MKTNSVLLTILIAQLLLPTGATADPLPPVLSTNPFNRPAWMDENTAPLTKTKTSIGNNQIVLRATLVAGNESLAAVGEKIIGIGQEVYGYTLLSVSNGSAIFSNGLNQLQLKVAGDQKDTENETD